jgi:hypothetical protein
MYKADLVLEYYPFEGIVKGAEYLEDNHGGLYSKRVKIDDN